MRLFLPLAAFALFAAPALAQTVSPAPLAVPTTKTSASAPAEHSRLTMDQRFAKANTTHDGHLTLAQAKTGYPSVARHFTEIDTGNQGYVTEDQIRAWQKTHRAQRRAQRVEKTASNG